MTLHELIATPLSDSTVFVVYHNGQMIAPPFHKSAPPRRTPCRSHNHVPPYPAYHKRAGASGVLGGCIE